MMNYEDDRPDSDKDTYSGRNSDNIRQQRRDPSFNSFAATDDEGYEEPDRDTDFDAGYQTDSVEEEEEYDDTFPDDEDDDLLFEDDAEPQYDPDPSGTDEPDTWLAKEDDFEPQEADDPHWPWGLIAVAVVALVLLAAGGYGVMQQRAATEAELLQLRSALATSASPEEVRDSRGALQELQLTHEKLVAETQALTLENRRLSDTVAGLEAQLGVQQSALGKAAPAGERPSGALPANNKSPATPAKPTASAPTMSEAAAPAVKPAPAPAKPAAAPPAAASSGRWFVNFGSYATRDMAQSWATKLHPTAGKVIIAPNTKDGRTLYRLRVIGLANRDSAKAVARNLEAEQRVAELWVGME